MSLTNAVAAQFQLILRNKCMSGPQWSGGCVFHLSTAVLGYFLIVVVALAQIPMLFRILKHKSRDNDIINPFGIGVMAFMASNNVAYAVNKNLPLSTWGEGVLQIVQCLIIINLLFIHQGQHRQAVAFTLIYVTVMVGSLTPVIPAKLVMFLKLINMPMDIVRKMTVMYKSHKQGAPVSSVASRRSLVLLNLCSLGRLLTACVHSHDVLLIVAYGQESLCTLALSTVAMVLRRRWRKRIMNKNRKISTDEDFFEDMSNSNSSSGEDGIYADSEGRLKRRRRRLTKTKEGMREEEGDLSSSGIEESVYETEMRRKRRRFRRIKDRRSSEDMDGEMSSSYCSGMDECVRFVERQKES